MLHSWKPPATSPSASSASSTRSTALSPTSSSPSQTSTAAALVARVPGIADALREGRLCLTTVVEVAKVLTPENRDTVLPRFFGLSRREAQEVVAELRPREAPPLRDVVTVSRPPAAAAAALPIALSSEPDLRQVGQPTNSAVSTEERSAPAAEPLARLAPPAPLPAPDAVEPLTAELTRIHVTVPRRLLAKLEAARAALSHSHPGAGMAEILEAGLDLVLDRQAKRNGLVKRPRKEPRPSKNPDHVPAHARREVWERDGGKCQFPVASGGVCGSPVGADLHHVRTRARGGPHTAANLITVCGFHHDLETRREFGDALVDRCVREKRARRLIVRDAVEDAARPSSDADARQACIDAPEAGQLSVALEGERSAEIGAA